MSRAEPAFDVRHVSEANRTRGLAKTNQVETVIDDVKAFGTRSLNIQDPTPRDIRQCQGVVQDRETGRSQAAQYILLL
ncbi:hypothetical protein PC114_g26018 [Phytophthora cactorum]|nr:hypothetical protein PC114_g26018 [Phytophthora cactorum]KAG3172046.1 hypothetical protein PC128_g18584 [Phytophthora cactorum]